MAGRARVGPVRPAGEGGDLCGQPAAGQQPAATLHGVTVQLLQTNPACKIHHTF